MDTKECTGCCTEKPLEEFHRAADAKDGRRSYCKICHCEYQKTRRQDPAVRAKDNERSRGWHRKHAAAASAAAHRSHIRRKYGITIEEFEEQAAAQDNLCAACGCLQSQRQTGRHKKGQRRRLCIDNDHATGKIRGLLCDKCNRALGLLDDNLDKVRRLAIYLSKHKEHE